MFDSKRFGVERATYRDGYSVYIWKRTPQGSKEVDVYLPPETKKVDPLLAVNDERPTLEITSDEAQRLIDELWRAGLRPTEGEGSAGSFSAQKRHLEDMRRLVFEVKDRV